MKMAVLCIFLRKFPKIAQILRFPQFVFFAVQNKKIENFLHKHSRFGIPLNVMYNNSYPEGIVLSELLTKKEILEIINKMQGNL